MSRMHRYFIVATALLLLSSLYNPQATQGAQAPPIGPEIVREGDFAVALVETLDIGRAPSEAEAENLLTSIGIVPGSGWIADYPVTPDVLRDLEKDIDIAAKSNLLKMSKDEALKRFAELTDDLGLPSVESSEGKYGVAPSGPEPYSGYSSSDLENYYAEEGPPIITYYPPPYDYDYLYDWVPYPFYWYSFSFPGFFILHDFHGVHRVATFRHHGFHGKRGFFRGERFGTVSNHLTDPSTRRVTLVRPGTRMVNGVPQATMSGIRTGGFTTNGGRQGAAAIFQRSLAGGTVVRGPATGFTGNGRGAGLIQGVSPSGGRSFPSSRENGIATIPGRSFVGQDRQGTLSRAPMTGQSLGAPLQTRQGFSGGFEQGHGGRSITSAPAAGFPANRGPSLSRGGEAFSGGGFRGAPSHAMGEAFHSAGGGGFSGAHVSAGSMGVGHGGGGLSGGGFHGGGGFSGGGFHGGGGFSGGGGHGGGGFSGGGFRGR